MRQLLRFLPSRRVCGCSVLEDSNVKGKKFSTHKTGKKFCDAVDTKIHCEGCDSIYYRRDVFDIPKKVHPDWREWSRKKKEKHENEMGRMIVEEKNVYHPRYTEVFNWTDPKNLNEMRRSDVAPDRVIYSLEEL